MGLLLYSVSIIGRWYRMIFSIDTVCKELRWEYGYTKKKAMQIIKDYEAQGKYEFLCYLITKRKNSELKRRK